jgi:hypothetical protein
MIEVTFSPITANVDFAIALLSQFHLMLQRPEPLLGLVEGAADAHATNLRVPQSAAAHRTLHQATPEQLPRQHGLQHTQSTYNSSHIDRSLAGISQMVSGEGSHRTENLPAGFETLHQRDRSRCNVVFENPQC